jgi:large subunit ribosomal protein L21
MNPTRYAIIEAQGLQLRVAPEEEHVLPHMGAEAGRELTFDRVLLIGGGEGGVKLGTPVVEGATVTARVLGTEKGKKISVGVFKRRKKYRRKIGYRDTLTRVKILDIVG